MGILVRIVLAITAIVSTGLSSLGFRNSNWVAGLIFVIIAIVAIVFLVRVLWEVIGCATTLGLVVGFVALILYLTGAFSTGGGLLGGIFSMIGGEKEKPANQTLYGTAIAVTGDTIRLDRDFYLYGIAAPRLDQACINSIGGRYGCGQSSRQYLEEKLQGQQPVCTTIVAAPLRDGAVPAICNVGEYDLGALMVAAGWAIPDVAGGYVYVAYEAEAKKRRNGMWQGRFSSPWEWRRAQMDQQQRLKTIKVQEPKKEPSLLMKNFLN